LVEKSFRMTENSQIAFSPEFIYCDDCGYIKRGAMSHPNQDNALNDHSH